MVTAPYVARIECFGGMPTSCVAFGGTMPTGCADSGSQPGSSVDDGGAGASTDCAGTTGNAGNCIDGAPSENRHPPLAIGTATRS